MAHADELRLLLRHVRRRWAGVALTTAGARAMAGAAIVALAGVATERLLAPSDAVLMGLVVVTLGGACGMAAWMLLPLRRRPADRRIARFIEERSEGFEDRLTSAVDVLEHDPASVFAGLMLADAASRAREVRPDAVVSGRALRRAGWRLGAAVALLAFALMAVLPPASRAVRAARLRFVPDRFSIDVEPGDARVVAGEPLRIRARLSGLPDAYDGDPPLLTVTAGGETRAAPMRRAGDVFEFDVAAVTSSFRYRVSVARVSSPEFSIAALYPPRVAEIDVEYQYPAFTGLPPRREPDGGDIYAPAGTRVRLRVKADKPLRSGALVMTGGRRIDLDVSGEAEGEGAFSIDADGSYRVALADTDGLESGGDTEYFIRVMDDRPPDVRILRPAGDRKVTALEEVTIEARADDDYGIERLDLVYSVRGRQEQAVPLRGGGSPTSRTGSHLLFVEDLGVQPGDFITYYARARDVGRGKRPREARSDIYFLEVKPFEEEFERAQSAAMGAGRNNRSLDNLVRAQKDIISATWKLDRRKEGGRSADDIRAVARAQGELRAQAEAGAGPARAIGRGRRGERGGSEGTAEPLARAAEAMGRAQAQLDAVRTAEALPHEMEALNQLLRAEAEIRRRQVSRQQQANAGSGSGRADRDLSSLFDRELQRQQATNYETRRQSESGQDDAEKDPLEEIRELARRQNELSQRQRDLARAKLDADELKRQLERLTREQNELSERAEALQQQLARERAAARPQGQQASSASSGQASSTSSGQGGGQAQPGGQAESGERMREIAGEMRGAAGDLRRQDLDAARQRGERAAAELRELERELRDSRPEARERALGAARGTDAETRTLVDRLARARDLGDRLGELGQKADRLGPDAKATGEPSPEPGGGSATELARLQQEYARALRDAQALVDQLRREYADLGRGLTPEAHEYSMGAPGTQAFKQDYSRWASLRRDVALALERYEQAVSEALARKITADRMQAGASAELPDEYRALVARYYEALARKKK